MADDFGSLGEYRDPRGAFGRGPIPKIQDIGNADRPYWMPPPAQPPAAAPTAPAAGMRAEPIPVGQVTEGAPGVRGAINRAIPSADIGQVASRAWAPVGRTLSGAANLAGKVAPWIGAGVEGASTARDALTPGMSGIDQAARVAEGAGRIAGMGSGAMAGGAAGTALLPGVGTVLGGGIGGTIGFFAPDLANKAFNWVTGNNNQLASDKAAQLREAGAPGVTMPTASANSANSADAAEMAMRRGAARDIAAPQANVDGAITRTGNSYSGDNVQAGAPIFNADGTQRAPAKLSVLPAADTAGGGGATGIEARNSALRASLDAYGPGAHSADGSGGTTGFYTGVGNAGKDPDAWARSIDGSRIGSGIPARLRATLDNQRAIAADQNATTARGQDIGFAGQQVSAASHRYATDIGAQTQRDVANIGADQRGTAAELRAQAQVEAASKRANPTVVVGGGMVPVDDGMGGIKYVTAPQRLVGRLTGEDVGGKPAAAAPKAPPAIGAVVKRGDGTSYRFKGGDPSKAENWEKA